MTESVGVNRNVFGVPAVLTAEEAATLQRAIAELWRLTYGTAPGNLKEDFESCKRIFGPLLRGQSVRDRLAQIPKTPPGLRRSFESIGEPLVVNAGDDVLITGLEGRIILKLLGNRELEPGDLVVLTNSAVAEAEREALEIYRRWSWGRLSQVIELRAGQGHEVMQAIAVGLVVALLVNRSDRPERAVQQLDHSSADGNSVDRAVYAGAERFAEALSGKGRRSSSEQRLKGGYALTEARRRLAHRLAIVKDGRSGGGLLYVPADYGQEVVDFLGRDLARRPGLSEEALTAAFDQLVVAFRAAAGELEHRSMAFDRPSDTRQLRENLLDAFRVARSERP